MNKTSLVSLAVAALCALPVSAQDMKTPRPSPKGTVMQTVGITDFTVAYSRPGVKGREIWGKLVPFGEVWRTGANEATIFETSTDMNVGGKPLPKGKYSLHTIPGKDEWTVIFNSVADQWGSYSYDKAKDVLRVMAKPMSNPMTENLTITFANMTQDSADLLIDWEKVRVSVPIKLDTVKLTMAEIERALAAAKADDWKTPLAAARFANDNKMTDKATEWLDRSIKVKETPGNLYDKAKMQYAAGKKDLALETAKKAAEAGKAQNASSGMMQAIETLSKDMAAGKKL